MISSCSSLFASYVCKCWETSILTLLSPAPLNVTTFSAFGFEIHTDQTPLCPANTSQAPALLLVGSPCTIQSFLPAQLLQGQSPWFVWLAQEYLDCPGEQLKGNLLFLLCSENACAF